MSLNKFDMIVIGTGPGGEGAAMQAAKEGRRVAVFERYNHIGGGCTHWGTIPSKALRFSIYTAMETLNSPFVKSMGLRPHPSLAMLRASARSIITKQESMRQNFYERNQVPVIRGQARFVDPHTVEIDDGTQYKADNFVIAVGSRPFRPDGVDFNHPKIFDSDTILELNDRPHSITIYGAGVIGCEYASMFRNLGIKVNLVNTREKLLEFLDDEIIDALSYHLRDKGILIRHNEQFARIEGHDDGAVLYLESGKQLKTDIVLWANGRSGNVENLGLENIGLTPNKRGHIKVNEQLQTDVEHIYAAGDVIGYPSLASAAYMQGRAAALHACGCVDRCMKVTDIPTGIYTSPEISSIGQTERELTAAKVPYEVGHSQFKSLARAQITGRTVGMLKILFHRESLEILGVHCFGANAAEIIHIGQAIMKQPPPNNTLDYFINTTFNYPTMAEAYRVAALNGYNRVF
ncbi:Si-specific NAD(P)(+) transhydrogenase [Aureliella helgolandensis]|uniref:Soluble pyridine nucleotide transhydrogenase n=1 Tax=Aureliella helgolandensis TaxID=2527968 RepID=A0A518G165_9BACT|nr:Si-specific NAD(P)(+) transhydrogenase [Aureliella helgolandensis]QDV22280.1 Soluble pyridine nucleotide transhydrogenase [Aureliella helgolandensis]